MRFLLLTLAVTPARAVLDWGGVVKLRRLCGVTTACYAGAHMTLYCIDQNWHLGTVASEIVLRFYLTIGFLTLLMLGVLAVTSTDGWQKRLGAALEKAAPAGVRAAAAGAAALFPAIEGERRRQRCSPPAWPAG